MLDHEMIRNRIIERRRMRLGDVALNPRNWKDHPEDQGAALDGILEEVGWVGTPIAYYSARNGGALTWADGNLRGQRYSDLEQEVAITDLTDAEADLILLTYDPIAAMAHANAEKLDAVLRDAESGNAAVMALMAQVAEEAGLYEDEQGVTPSLDDLATKYGEPQERDFWPVIRVQVSPETKARFDSLWAQAQGVDDAAKMDALLRAVDENILNAEFS